MVLRRTFHQPGLADVGDRPPHPYPAGGHVDIGHLQRGGFAEAQTAVAEHQHQGSQPTRRHRDPVELLVGEVPLFGFRQSRQLDAVGGIGWQMLGSDRELEHRADQLVSLRTRDALIPLPSKRTDPSTDRPVIHTWRSSKRTSRSGTSLHRGSTTVSSSERYPATVLGALVALVDSQRSAIVPNVTLDSAGSVHVPVTWSETCLSSQL